jgi:hypothetical protein
MAEQKRVILIPNDPLAWLKKEWIRRPLTGLVFARGDWCPFCVHNVNQWLEQLPRLQDLGGRALFLVNSQVSPSMMCICASLQSAAFNLPD